MYKICTFAAEDGQTIPVPDNNMQADYKAIKRARFNQGLTQEELAKKANLYVTTISKAENGGSITPKSNKAIRDALGIK